MAVLISNSTNLSRFQGLSRTEIKNLLKISISGNIKSYSTKYKCLSSKKTNTIEVAGMPRSYKTTLILKNTFDFRTNGLVADFIRERSSNVNKRNFPVQYSLTIANKTIESLLSQKLSQIYLLDRGIYDQLAFIYTFYKMKIINKKLVNAAAEYLIGFFAGHINGLLVLHSNPEVSLEREGPRKKPGHVLNSEFLTELCDSYLALPKIITRARKEIGFGDIPFPIIELDSTDKWESYSQLFFKSTVSCLKFNLGCRLN